MGQIYTGTDFELTIETSIPLAALATLQILYMKPGSSIEGVIGSVSIVNGTRMRTDVPKTINAASVPAGRWLFHTRTVDGGGKESLGELTSLLIERKWG